MHLEHYCYSISENSFRSKIENRRKKNISTLFKRVWRRCLFILKNFIATGPPSFLPPLLTSSFVPPFVWASFWASNEEEECRGALWNFTVINARRGGGAVSRWQIGGAADTAGGATHSGGQEAAKPVQGFERVADTAN